MSGATRQEIESLVQQGLDHYGTGDVQRALELWRRALELDPGHAEAREYLETALEDEATELEPKAATRPDAVLREAQQLLAQDPEAALELLEEAAARHPEHLQLHGYVDMVRSRMLKRYRERLGQGVPRQVISGEQVMRYNLPPDAGFLLSLVDGMTPVKDLVSVCGFDEFRTLRLLARLVDAGILEIAP